MISPWASQKDDITTQRLAMSQTNTVSYMSWWLTWLLILHQARVNHTDQGNQMKFHFHGMTVTYYKKTQKLAWLSWVIKAGSLRRGWATLQEDALNVSMVALRCRNLQLLKLDFNSGARLATWTTWTKLWQVTAVQSQDCKEIKRFSSGSCDWIQVATKSRMSRQIQLSLQLLQGRPDLVDKSFPARGQSQSIGSHRTVVKAYLGQLVGFNLLSRFK